VDDGLGQSEVILNDVLNVVWQDEGNKIGNLANWQEANQRGSLIVPFAEHTKIDMQKPVLFAMAKQQQVRTIQTGKVEGQGNLVAMFIF